jgi:hypothetical protein
LIVSSPAPPIAELGEILQDLCFRRHALLHRVSSM